ncbi:MAG: PorV/PorQ family protein [Calditrichaeota bacterium]|nr:MAG: PorV/PorQ family protein [Calditrichota bacterium]
MNTIFKIILILFFGLTAVSSLDAQGNLGQSGLNFLQIGVDPRGTAFGGGGIALTSKAYSLYWNPAGAIYTENLDICFSYTDWFLDTRLAFGGITKRLGNLGVVGFSVTSLYMDDMEITTVYESEGTGQFFSAGDISLGLSFAKSLTDRFSFGITAKYVREDIWNETADQIAFDIGSLYKTDFYNLRIGMAIRNVSGKLRFSGSDIDKRLEEELSQNISENPRAERLAPEFRLPQIFQLGIAFDPFTTENSRFTLLADVDTPNDNTERVIFAAEYAFHNLAFLRGGYRMNYDIGDFSLGAGLNLTVSGVNSMFDYSFSTQGVMGDVHRLGIGFSL